MKKNIHVTIFCIVFFVFSLAVFAQDAGLDLSISPGIFSDSQATSFSTGFSLNGWWKLPLGTSGSLFDGAAHAGMSFSSENDPSFNYDIDRFRLLFVFPNPSPEIKSLNLEMGRLTFREKTGLILSHPADGLKLGLTYDLFNAYVQAGHTGLIMRNNNSISLSLYDQNIASDDSRLFGTSRFLVLGELAFPKLFKQSLTFSFVAQQDLNPEKDLIPEWSIDPDTEDIPRGGKFNSQYASIYLNGAIFPDLFYATWFTYGSGRTMSWLEDENSSAESSYQYVPIHSFMAGFSLNYYWQEFYNSAFNARFLFASGDKDYSTVIEGNTEGDALQFVPITSSPFGLVFSPLLSNLIVTELGGSIKPLEEINLQTGMRLFAFFRPTDGPVATSGIKPGEKSSLLGFEIDIFGNYRMFSDLGITLNTGLFFPVSSPSGAFDKKASRVQYSIQLAAVLGL